jgi:hypothetical protein
MLSPLNEMRSPTNDVDSPEARAKAKADAELVRQQPCVGVTDACCRARLVVGAVVQ